MSNETRKGCKDVWNAFMCDGAVFAHSDIPHCPMTATELGNYTRLLKSQINHILTGMEERGLIRRERSTQDKRVIYVHPLESALPRYQEEHEKVLNIVDCVFSALGEEDAKTLTALMRKATAVVNDSVFKEVL